MTSIFFAFGFMITRKEHSAWSMALCPTPSALCSLLHDPLRGLTEIMGRKIRIAYMLRPDIARIVSRKTGPDQHRTRACTMGQLYIAPFISHHIGAAEVYRKISGRLVQQTGPRFSAVAHHGIFRLPCRRVMRTIVDAVQRRAFMPEHLPQTVMRLLHQRFREISPCHTGLIRY